MCKGESGTDKFMHICSLWMHVLMRTACNLNLIVDGHDPRLVLHPQEPFLRSCRIPWHVCIFRVGGWCDSCAVWEQPVACLAVVGVKRLLV